MSTKDVLASSCPHWDVCSGCGGPSIHQPMAQRAVSFARSHGLSDYVILSDQTTGWRTRAKLAVRQQGGDHLAIGLFRRDTHLVVPIPRCPAHHPAINRAVALLAELPPSLGYHEATASGQLRYIQAVVERSSGRVQMTLVLNCASLDCPEVLEWERRAEGLYALDPVWHSFWINLQPLRTNTIFGPVWRHLLGERYVWETVVGCDIPILPSHFSQANLGMFERLLNDLILLLPPQSTVVELFAGMGVISLAIRRHCASVTAIERDGAAAEPFGQARQRLPRHLQDGLTFLVDDAQAADEVLSGATTVIVDPPRKGLSRALIQKIAQAHNIRTVFYVSCHFPTLERDVEELMEKGAFTLAFARGYLFFPGTDQIETLVQLVRLPKEAERSG